MSAHRIPADYSFADWVIQDPGTGKPIPSSDAGCVKLTIAASETNTLADPPSAGLFLIITCFSRSAGSRVVTAATRINKAGNTTITFGALHDTIVLESIPYNSTGGFRWHVVSNDGCTLG